MMEFHISQATRSRYEVDDVLFSYTGNVVFADLAASRALANKINEVRGAANDPAAVVNPAALFAMGLIDELSHALVAHYRKTTDPEVMKRALTWFEGKVGAEGVEKLLRTFVVEFPMPPSTAAAKPPSNGSPARPKAFRTARPHSKKS